MRQYATRLTRKGQITIPVEIRRALGLREGDRVAVTLENGHASLQPAQSVVERTFGALKSERGPLTLEQERDEFELAMAEDAERCYDR